MGTSQSKRSNKISKFRSSSVGAVGEFAEEDESNTNSNNSGKLSSMKGIFTSIIKKVFLQMLVKNLMVNIT